MNYIYKPTSLKEFRRICFNFVEKCNIDRDWKEETGDKLTYNLKTKRLIYHTFGYGDKIESHSDFKVELSWVQRILLKIFK